MILGVSLILLGLAGLFAAYLMRPRRSGMSAEMWEALQVPEYVRRARAYCHIYGYPTSEWRRFEGRAIGDIIIRGVRR